MIPWTLAFVCFSLGILAGFRGVWTKAFFFFWQRDEQSRGFCPHVLPVHTSEGAVFHCVYCVRDAIGPLRLHVRASSTVLFVVVVAAGDGAMLSMFFDIFDFFFGFDCASPLEALERGLCARGHESVDFVCSVYQGYVILECVVPVPQFCVSSRFLSLLETIDVDCCDLVSFF